MMITKMHSTGIHLWLQDVCPFKLC